MDDEATASEAVETVCQPEADLSNKLPDEGVARASVQLLKGMADGTRLKILCMLRGREVSVHD